MKCLLVTPIFTASPRTGGGQRTLTLLGALSKVGQVDVMLLSEPTQRYLEADLESFNRGMEGAHRVFVCQGTPQFLPGPAAGSTWLERRLHLVRRLVHWLRPRAHFYRATPTIAADFAERLNRDRYDVVVTRYLRTAAASGALQQTSAPVVVDLDDLDDAVLASRASAATTSRWIKPLLRLQLRQTRRVMERLLKRCRHVFVASASDLLAVRGLPSSVLPNIPFRADRRHAVGGPAPSAVALFVGTHSHRANREGVRHFVAACWPQIVAAVPEARFRVVGSGGWETEKEGLELQPGVEVVGQVERLDGAYAAARVCVSPIQEGAGTKIKVLEALSFARPVVVLSHSARGYEQLSGCGVFSASGDTGLAETCIDLLRDPSRGMREAAAGRKIVERDYSQAAVDRVVREAVARIGQPERVMATGTR